LLDRQEHKAGEKLFVDWAGTTTPIYDPRGGPVQQAHLFIAVLGASSYTYAEATPDEQLPSWIGAHVRAFEFYQGVPKLAVPDNTKTGVTKACRYDPDLNPDLSGDGYALRRGRGSGAAIQASGQGQS
jgi:transposase